MGVINGRLRLVRGGVAAVSGPAVSIDPMLFQESCVAAFEASQVARGFAQTTMENGSGTLDRFLAACGRPAWEVTREDVDRVVAGLVAQGLSAATRRLYVQTFKGFHAFLSARKAAEIEAAFGIRMLDPVDEFNAARHVDSGSPSAIAPPGQARRGWRSSSISSRPALPAPESTPPPGGTTHCFGRCTWPDCGPRRARR